MDNFGTFPYKLGWNRTISSGTAPVNTVAPVVSGVLEVDETLTCSDGTWTGTEPITYSYQWYRGVTPIGADQNTYVVVTADIAETITCQRTGINAYGSDTGISNGVVILPYRLSNALHYWSWRNAAIVGTTMNWTDSGSVGGLTMTNPDVPSLPTISGNMVNFDGIAQYLNRAVSNFRSGDTTGVMHFHIKHYTGVGAYPFSNSLIGSDNYRMHSAFSSANKGVGYLKTIGFQVDTTTPTYTTGVNLLSIVQDGTNGILLIDGVEVAIAGSWTTFWFNLLAGQSDTITFGGINYLTLVLSQVGIKDIAYTPYVSKASAIADAQSILANSL